MAPVETQKASVGAMLDADEAEKDAGTGVLLPQTVQPSADTKQWCEGGRRRERERGKKRR